jgi:ribose-phosphate pyrophosphokinase
MSTKELQVQDFPKKFPCGEIHVRIASHIHTLINKDGFITIEKRIQNSDDVMEILMLADAIRRTVAYHGLKLRLVLPYVPYSRQDRVMVTGESLSIKVFADLINSVKFERVEIWDPHSDVTPALLNNCVVVPQEDLLVKTLGERGWEHYTLVCPDAGARKKILKCQTSMGIHQVVYADKIREAKTGKILGTSLNFDEFDETKGFQEDLNFIIVDDICDGGRTFIEIAKEFKRHSSATLFGVTYHLHLHVTHGFFTQGLEPLLPYFDVISCANLMNKELGAHPAPGLTYYTKVPV